MTGSSDGLIRRLYGKERHFGTETYRCGLEERKRRTVMNRTIGISVGGLILLLIIVAIIF
jgi:hypothetical protein